MNSAEQDEPVSAVNTHHLTQRPLGNDGKPSTKLSCVDLGAAGCKKHQQKINAIQYIESVQLFSIYTYYIIFHFYKAIFRPENYKSANEEMKENNCTISS